MKLKVVLLLAFISTSTFAQDTEFKFSKEGLTDFIVTSYDSPAKDLFKRAVLWIKENNKATDAVKSSVENEKIVFPSSGRPGNNLIFTIESADNRKIKRVKITIERANDEE